MANVRSANAVIVNIDTFAFISASPNPVQVNNPTLITYLVNKPNPLATIRENHFTGFTVTITKPDGTIDTKSGLSADATSTGYFSYTPNQVGTYSLQVTFPGQWANSSAGDMTFFGPVFVDTERWFKPSTSTKVALVVQEEPVPGYPDVPLPTDYWTRPIYSENKGWWQISDNWLMQDYDNPQRFFNGQGAFAPYTSAPNSAHVLWTEPITFGGLVGAQFGDRSYYTGLVYEQYYTPVILSGRIIYNDHGPTAGGGFGPRTDYFGARCLDLYTGEEIWYLNDTVIDFAQILDIETPNEHGPIPYLWSAPGLGFNPFGVPPGLKWVMYDAWTGRQIATIDNVTTGTAIFGPKGEILMYILDPMNNWLAMWNSTKAIAGGANVIDTWSPALGTVVDWKGGIEWNVTIPHVNAAGLPAIKAISLADNAILVSDSPDVLYPQTQLTYPAAIAFAGLPATLERQSNGNYPTSVNTLWTHNVTDVYDFVELHWNINEGMYSLYDDAKQVIHTYDVKTGNELSVTDPIAGAANLWTLFSHSWMAYGRTYIWGYDGHIRAFDGKTGDLVWDYYLGNAGTETPYGSYAIYAGATIADNKVFVSPDEHSPDANLWRGSRLYAIDADTGKGLWNISGWYHYQAISDGILTAVNSYDQKIYTFGKGPSKTMVSAPQTQVTLGDKVMITGAVTDESPGQPGTPAVSDESMAAWMEYLHMQKPFPSNVTGVEVVLSVLDSNNNYYEIGRATSDTSGTFGLWWEPEIPGKYVITATFAGSESYGSSYAQTYLGVVEAPPASPTPPPVSLPPTETYVIGTGIAIIIAIGIVGFLILRRQ
jgi:hypothetical protein